MHSWFGQHYPRTRTCCTTTCMVLAGGCSGGFSSTQHLAQACTATCIARLFLIGLVSHAAQVLHLRAPIYTFSLIAYTVCGRDMASDTYL
jgi:hypothetical protein